MGDYIEREKAMEIVKRTSGDYAAAWTEIRQLPAADVAPVVHGTWKLLGNGDGVCDQCHMLQKHIWDDDNSQRYCGCCGAIMNGGRE